MVTEIIIYKLKEDFKNLYWSVFIEKSLPQMKKWNIEVGNYGFSIEDPLTFHLIRFFNSLEHRNDLLKRFYNSDDWQKGAKIQIVESIESYKTTLFESSTPVSNESII